jgi:hypothetical protein
MKCCVGKINGPIIRIYYDMTTKSMKIRIHISHKLQIMYELKSSVLPPSQFNRRARSTKNCFDHYFGQYNIEYMSKKSYHLKPFLNTNLML